MTNNFSQYALLVALVIVATIPKCNSSNWSPIYRVPGTCECTDNPECGCENNAECTNIENNEHICECTQGFSGECTLVKMVSNAQTTLKLTFKISFKKIHFCFCLCHSNYFFYFISGGYDSLSLGYYCSRFTSYCEH